LIHTTSDVDIAERYAQGAGGGRKRSDPVYKDNKENIFELDGNEYVNKSDGTRLSFQDIQDMLDSGDLNPFLPTEKSHSSQLVSFSFGRKETAPHTPDLFSSSLNLWLCWK